MCECRCLKHGGGRAAVFQSVCVYGDGSLQEVVGGERGRLDGKALKTAHQAIIPLLPPWSKRHGERASEGGGTGGIKEIQGGQ